MYKVISANRAPKKTNKNWRIFEKEMMEKHFGKVLNVNGEDGSSVIRAYNEYKDSIEYIRWYPDPELMNRTEYEGMVWQNKEIGNLPYITNSAEGFLFVQNKELAFQRWKEVGVNCPDFFVYKDKKDFYVQQEEHQISYPFLIRINNSVGGYNTLKVDNESMLEKSLDVLDADFDKYNKSEHRIQTVKMCVKMVNSIANGVNTSYRIHVAGDRVISGYARVVDESEWCAITAGKFKMENINNFVTYNKLCETIMTEYESHICQAVHSLGLNHQGVDVIIDQDDNTLCFLEVQPTYASGYPPESGVGVGTYKPPFWNPADDGLVKFLQENKNELEKHLPRYYYNWLDKRNHFDLVYKSLKEFLDVRS